MFWFTCLFICVILVHSSSAQWLHRNNGLPDTINVLGGTVIEPVDSLTAFVIIDDGKFYKTSDAGMNWIDITSPTFPSSISVEDISVINEDSIWICGNSSDTATIYASFDGGGSWVEQYTSTEGNLYYIEMFSGDSGMVAGNGYDDVPAPMIQTTDGGLHWIKKNYDYLIGDYALANAIDMVDMDVIFFQKKWSSLSKSTNGGTTWDSLYTPITGEGVNFYNRKFGLLTTAFGQIIKSVDGGITWDLIADLPINSPRCLEFLPGNPAKIWLSIEWKLFFSEDSGKSWTEYPFEGDFWSFDIEFVDDLHGWIIARDGVYYTKAGDRIVTGLKNKSQIQIDFKLAQNYPNPFNQTTQIRYSLTQPEKVKITVFNALGQRIETLLNKNMPAGQHEITFNAGQLPSGTYFYKLVAGEYTDSKRMMYVK